jgi:hypothetical protein
MRGPGPKCREKELQRNLALQKAFHDGVRVRECRNVRIGETLLASEQERKEVSRWVEQLRRPYAVAVP